ncbi:MAG: hypothetical protein J0G96_08555 [Flavobacteriia bacterium]|nr:hypothetical protein [Flavobacteriia bacterium]OJX36244.1 MAG: hypothetical protein BGO87_07245 [Flavobacteriia bacterium 40-80]
MNKLYPFFLQQRANYQKWDFLIFTALTLLSILNGQTTVFYLIYFFWWNELLRIIVDRILYKKNPNAKFMGDKRDSIFSSFFMMGIYFVFIVVFFGFIASYKHDAEIYVNMKTLFFQNWFFNVNLLFIIAERIFLHKTHQPMEVSFGGFTTNMIILHISIIVGGCLLFFVVQNYPETFTPENLWGSVLVALPFLLLKMAVTKF